FFAGSYFPPTDQGGRPGFPAILAKLHQAWTDDHAKVLAVADRVDQAMQQADASLQTTGNVKLAPRQWLDAAVQQAGGQFDAVNDGFPGGGGTMFPQEPLLSMLLTDATRNHNAQALSMATATLQAMAEGGVMDQLAGGFHRYSTEPTWSIPHFEKMLYDNAQLLSLYAQAYALTKQPLFKHVALRTAQYLTTDMRAPDGGFYSAQDSQIDGVEGVSYVWTRQQIESILGAADTKRFLALYTLTPMPAAIAGQKQSPGGVLRLDRDQAQALADKQQLIAQVEALTPLRAKLLAARNRRPQPVIDEKIVTADNALTILGFLQAGRDLHDASLTRTAVATANWEWQHAFDPETGMLRHQFFHGHPSGDGFLSDYAPLGQAFLAVYRDTGAAASRERARQIADAMLKHFQRPDGRLAATADTADLLVAPPVEGDSVEPSGQSAAVALLLGLSADGGDVRYAIAARRALAPLSAQTAAQPIGWGALLSSLGRPTLVAALKRAPAGGSQVASGLPNSADHVRATAHLTTVGKATELRVAIDVDEDYHINANPASGPDLIPTTLTLDGQSDLKVRYPPAQTFKAPFAPQGIAVYTGHIELRAHLPYPSAVPRQAKLRVQACNDKYCLAPATVAVPVNQQPRRAHVQSPA
ncbi:MAG: thioredoxin domain-containing protein, partial [Rhodanobacteraceae bacterium]